MFDSSERKFCLLPEGSNQAQSTLRGLQAPTREVADFSDGV